MAQDSTDADLATLRERHPGWFFTTFWTDAGLDTAQRYLCGQRHGVIVADLTADGVSGKIRREEARLIPRE